MRANNLAVHRSVFRLVLVKCLSCLLCAIDIGHSLAKIPGSVCLSANALDFQNGLVFRLRGAAPTESHENCAAVEASLVLDHIFMQRSKGRHPLPKFII
jgi:hypothetical protein